MLSRGIRDVWLLWLALAIITTLPYVVAVLRTPDGQVFTGVLSAYDDTFTYFAWMRQSVDGHILTCDLFTSERQSCEFFLPLWVALGFVSRAAHVPIALTFHAARLLAILPLLFVARTVAASVMKSRTRLRYTQWMYAMSGGLGWLVYGLNNRNGRGGGVASGSIDLTMPEAIAFRAVFAQVHFTVGTTLLCGAIHLCLSALTHKKTSRAAVAGLLVSLLAVVHPYMVVVALVVTAAASLAWPLLATVARLQTAQTAATFAGAMFPGVAYLVYLDRSNWLSHEWLRVTDTLSPAPWEYALGFGALFVLAVPGFVLIWRTGAPYSRLLFIWCLSQAALLYLPVNFQRRFVEGLQLPLSIAASVAVFYISNRIGRKDRKYRTAFLSCVLVFVSLTSVGFIVGQTISAASPDVADPRRYVSADLFESLQWLRENAQPDAVVFSAYLTGNLTPSMTGLRVFLGHYGQTIRSDEKGAQVTAFYTNALSDNEARQLFADQQVRYVIYGPFERAISKDFTPPSWLELAHNSGDVEIYEVTDQRALDRR
ncbi:MAG TPA: hypothetical protein VGL29_15590 [Blastocatellia bacterium]